MNKKILFITAPYHAGVVEVAGKWVPLYLVSVAGACQDAGYPCEIYDAMTKDVGIDDIRRRIAESAPDVVAVSMITSTTPDALKVIQAAKQINPQIKTIAGGIHASFMAEDLLRDHDCLDYIVIGEGEQTMVELLAGIDQSGDNLDHIRGLAYRRDGNIIRTQSRSYMTDIDNMPMAWNLLDWEDYTYFILPGSRLGAVATSRGCMHGCTFCSQQKFWGQTWRARSAEDVVREIKDLHQQYQVDVVLLTDDYPTPDRVRWNRILDLLIEADLPVHLLMETRAEDIIRDRDILHKYRQAGIIHIYIGTEATSQGALDSLNKKLTIEESKQALALCRAHNIITETSMIIGFPDDTEESIAETIRLVQKYNPDFAHFLAIAPWPYADLYAELKPYIEETDYRRYNLVDPVIKPTAMSRKQVDQAIIDGYRRFYMGKFREVLNCADPFKRNYLLTAMKRMMQHSFIRKKLGSLHEQMPQEMKDLLERKEVA